VADALRRVLRDSPSLPVLVLALALLVYLAGDEGGFRGTTFLPATLGVLALVIFAAVALPRPTPGRAAKAAVGLLAAYAAFSYLSIIWADQQAIAWDGANRTVLYALVLALFALWPVRGKAAAFLMGAYALAIAGIGLVELLRAASSTDPVAYFYEGRLSEPTGYANANVALWFSAFWPCLLLGARREVHPAARGALLGGAGILLALSILGQSRSWLAAVPFMVVVAIAVVPGRARTIVALAIAAIATFILIGPLNGVYGDFDDKTPPSEYFGDGARVAVFVSAGMLVAGVIWGYLDTFVRVSSRTARSLSIGVIVAFVIALGIGGAAFVSAKGSPVRVGSDLWTEFKQGGSEPQFKGSRLGLAAGSYRYDYFRVALRNFKDHPLIGVGVDNYGRDYLRYGSTPEAPSYPHSIEFRVLSMTGLLGTALFFGALAAALIGAAGSIRRAGPLGGVAAGSAVSLFAYFMFHGSLDWLWEFAALGGAAFAALGLAIAIRDPRRGPANLDPVQARPDPADTRPPSKVALGAGLLAAAVMTIGITLPWLAERDLRNARVIAGRDPQGAIELLDRSASLNGFSTDPEVTAALIEVRRDRLTRAQRYLEEAARRDREDAFVNLELATIASAQDRVGDARQLVARARRLSPNDRVARQVDGSLARGGIVTPQKLNRLVLQDIDARIGPG